MKEKKFSIKDKVIIILLIVSILIFIANLILFVAAKNKLSKSNEECNCENLKVDTTLEKEISCTKKNSIKIGIEEISEYTISYNQTGEIINYQIILTTTYQDKNEYNSIKTSDNIVGLKFDDEKLETVRIIKYDNIKDQNGNIQHIWYKDMINSLKNDDYVCN